MRALLVDPFQREVHQLEIGEHIQEWHKWCDCDLFDHVCLGEHCGQIQDLWVDDEGLLRQPIYPMFKWENDLAMPISQGGLAGYGLITASVGPETIATVMPTEYAEQRIMWEVNWEHRLKPENYFDQLSRVYLGFGKGKSKI